jgi:hypothetical protein
MGEGDDPLPSLLVCIGATVGDPQVIHMSEKSPTRRSASATADPRVAGESRATGTRLCRGRAPLAMRRPFYESPTIRPGRTWQRCQCILDSSRTAPTRHGRFIHHFEPGACRFRLGLPRQRGWFKELRTHADRQSQRSWLYRHDDPLVL